MKKKVLGLRKEKFSPKYINYAGKETEMKEGWCNLAECVRNDFLDV